MALHEHTISFARTPFQTFHDSVIEEGSTVSLSSSEYADIYGMRDDRLYLYVVGQGLLAMIHVRETFDTATEKSESYVMQSETVEESDIKAFEEERTIIDRLLRRYRIIVPDIRSRAATQDTDQPKS